MKDPMPSAYLVLDFLAKNIVVDEIAHVVVRVAVEVAAGVETSDSHIIMFSLARPSATASMQNIYTAAVRVLTSIVVPSRKLHPMEPRGR